MMIFLIETDPIGADSVAFFLEREGFDVQTFFDSAKALEAIRADSPDLLITEVVLSGINGLRLCESLKRDEKTAEIPVIVLSVLQVKDRALACGAEAFILKPIDRATLVDAVNAVFMSASRRTA
jgi:DNA-binding response OmpR family regulator